MPVWMIHRMAKKGSTMVVAGVTRSMKRLSDLFMDVEM